MSLTNRQLKILKHLIQNYEIYITTEILAKVFNVSIRTIKNEISQIKEYTEAYSSFEVDSTPGKGIIINVLDYNSFFKDTLPYSIEDSNKIGYDDNKRDIYILKLLVENKYYLSRDKIMTSLHISESTFYKSYNNIKKLIQPFNLKLRHTKSKGYYIEGKEQEIRSLIARYDLTSKSPSMFDTDSAKISEIYSFIAETFIQFKYKVTDSILQNISFHVSLMLKRVKNGHFVESIDELDMIDKVEYQIAKVILGHFLKKSNIKIDNCQNEAVLLSQIILGKQNYAVDNELQQEINLFIEESFEKIKEKFGFNFESFERLRLLLVLHIVPLIYRINSGTQLKNTMKSEIKQQFPHAYDISLYFSLLFEQKFNYKMSLDETSYLTLYFNLGIEEMKSSKPSKSLLIITNLRHSETALLRHKLFTWFPNQIDEIMFINQNEKIDNLSRFDAIFTTEHNIEGKLSSIATFINIFPDNTDFLRINLALNGFTNKEMILEKFSESCFYYGSVKNKREVIKILCDNAQKTFDIDFDFHDKILSRELISSTFFGNLVAIPHPLSPISNETFASVAVLNKPIKWDEENDVKLIILLSIERNNPRAFQFWDHISHIIRDDESISKLLDCTSFPQFIKTVDILLDLDF